MELKVEIDDIAEPLEFLKKQLERALKERDEARELNERYQEVVEQSMIILNMVANVYEEDDE